jgi:hypothetical protein
MIYDVQQSCTGTTKSVVEKDGKDDVGSAPPRACVIASRTSTLTSSLSPQQHPTPPSTHATCLPKSKRRLRDNARSTSSLTFALIPISLTAPQNRRRPILRSPPATPRHSQPIHKSLRLGRRILSPLLGRAVPPAGRPGRLGRRPVYIPARCVHQRRDKGGCGE